MWLVGTGFWMRMSSIRSNSISARCGYRQCTCHPSDPIAQVLGAATGNAHVIHQIYHQPLGYLCATAHAWQRVLSGGNIAAAPHEK